MRLKDMKEEREKRGYSYEEISELSGVPIEVVENYFEESILPEYAMLLALERLFGISNDVKNHLHDQGKTLDVQAVVVKN